MYKIKKCVSIVVTVCVLICWWGYLFPELALTPDTVRVLENTGEQTSQGMSASDSSSPYNQLDYHDLYHRLLTAKPEEIRIRCRLFDKLSSYWEVFQNGSD